MDPAQSTITIALEINGRTFTDIIPKVRLMDPKTEDLLYGDELKEDMIVLVEPNHRYSEAASFEGFYNSELPVTNRWCRVTKIRTGNGGDINFIGVYTDGQKAIRYSAPTYGWHVKRHEWELKCYPGECPGESCVRDHSNN